MCSYAYVDQREKRFGPQMKAIILAGGRRLYCNNPPNKNIRWYSISVLLTYRNMYVYLCALRTQFMSAPLCAIGLSFFALIVVVVKAEVYS